MKKISRFIHVVDDNSVFNAINRKIINLDPESVEYIKENKNKIGIENYPNKIEIDNVITTVDEENKLIEELKNKTTDTQFQGLYLITTTSCNLDCDYCFYRCSISESLKHKEMMPFSVAKKAVDEFKKIVSNNIKDDEYWEQITLYGGEPMCNKELLRKIIPYIHDTFKEEYTDIVINTNLTLLDDEIIGILKENNVIVEVSIDGEKSIHDKHRKFIDGKGSYDIVINNAKKLISEGIKVIPMITATNDNVENYSNIVLEILDELGTDEFFTNVLITGTYDVKSDYYEKLAKSMVDLYRQVLSKKEDCDFSKLCESILGNRKVIAKNSCGGTRKITVFPNGKVYACQALQKLDINDMGDLDSDFSHNSNYDLWRKRNRFNNEECLDCEIIGSCGGGCATGSYNSTGSIYGIDYNQCKYSKELYKVLKNMNNKKN